MKLIASVLAVFFLASCHSKKAAIVVHNDVFYTCSMHPQVIQDKPGKCPICAMDLIAVNKTANDSLDEIKLSDQQMQLGNILLDTIKNGNSMNEMILPATLNIDQNN